jgi:hypothetical protein
MHMPRFTAEVTLHKRSGTYYRVAGNVVASRRGAVVLPALPRWHHSDVQAWCKKNGGTYWSEGKKTDTYGCYYDSGDNVHGIVCGGKSSDCDMF